MPGRADCGRCRRGGGPGDRLGRQHRLGHADADQHGDHHRAAADPGGQVPGRFAMAPDGRPPTSPTTIRTRWLRSMSPPTPRSPRSRPASTPSHRHHPLTPATRAQARPSARARLDPGPRQPV